VGFAKNQFEVCPTFLVHWLLAPVFAFISKNLRLVHDGVGDFYKLIGCERCVAGVGYHHAVLNLFYEGFERERRIKGLFHLHFIIIEFVGTQFAVYTMQMEEGLFR